MLKLRLDTTYLDLDADATLDIAIHNPLFDADGAEALYTLPFRLPATPTNLAALRHANRLDNADNTTTYFGASLEIEGLSFEPNGVLELDGQSFTSEYINATFKNQVPALLEQMASLKINDLLETITVPVTVAPLWKIGLTVSPAGPGIVYKVVVNTLPYTFTTPSGGVPVVAVTHGLALSINAAHPGLCDEGFNNELWINSLPNNDVAVNIGTLENMELVSSYPVGESARLCLQDFVDDISFTPDDRVTFPYCYWPNFYKKQVTGYRDRVNPWVDGTFVDNLPDTDSDKKWASTFVPFVRVPYILDRIAAAIPDYFTVHYGFFAETDGAQLIVFNNRSLDKVYYDRYNNGNTGEFKYLNGFKTSIALNEHVPDKSAEQFVKELMAMFQLYMVVVGTGIEFKKKRDMLASAPIDWTQLCEPAYTATRKLRRGFTFKYPDIRNEDKHFLPSATDSYPLQLAPYGTGFQEITLPANSTKVNSYIVALPFETSHLKCPAINQPGSSDEGGLGDNDYSFRLLFDRGVKRTDTSDNYVMATHDATDFHGDPAGSLSLDLNDPDGLYHLHHKGILELLADGQPVTLAVRLSIADILTVRKWANARRSILLSEGQVTAVIKSIRAKPGTNGIGISLVEFVQEK